MLVWPCWECSLVWMIVWKLLRPVIFSRSVTDEVSGIIHMGDGGWDDFAWWININVGWRGLIVQHYVVYGIDGHIHIPSHYWKGVIFWYVNLYRHAHESLFKIAMGTEAYQSTHIQVIKHGNIQDSPIITQTLHVLQVCQILLSWNKGAGCIVIVLHIL